MTNPTTSEVAIALNGFIDAHADAEVAIAALCDFIRTRHTDDTGSCRQRCTAVVELLETDAKRAAQVMHHVLRQPRGEFLACAVDGLACLAAANPVSPASALTY